jgi:hypothetical protein
LSFSEYFRFMGIFPPTWAWETPYGITLPILRRS